MIQGYYYARPMPREEYEKNVIALPQPAAPQQPAAPVAPAAPVQQETTAVESTPVPEITQQTENGGNNG